MLRIILFLATNLAIILVASITLSLLGFRGYLTENGINFNALLIFCFVFGMAGSFISLLLSKFLAKTSTGTKLIDDNSRDAREIMVLQTVRQLAKQAGIGMPDVGIFPANQANAFATGFNKNHALVSISQGMLNRYTDSEIKAVLAHEVSHIANGDMVTMTLLQGVINTFVMFLARVIGYTADKAIFKSKNTGPGYYIVVFLCEIILSIIASIIVMWFSRVREYSADKGAARMAGAHSMIAALEHLQKESMMPNEMPKSLNAFAIAEGKHKGFSLANLFMSHPPLEKRIEALRRG
ncbi:MAG: protease HtpX [Deferribacteraceae bacterium]|jgi:heat shock protein HtpX|nr:protease HtpX [Deferribacteraceae bacterium]